MLDGDEFVSGTIGISFDPDDKGDMHFIHCRDRIFGKFNHNHLRMTRLLMCLTICDFKEIASEILDFLYWASDLHEGIPHSCWEHWDAAYEGRSLPRSVKFSAKNLEVLHEILDESAQSIQETYWESAKADYDEVFNDIRENETDAYAQVLKQQWFDNWAKKLLQMSASTKE